MPGIPMAKKAACQPHSAATHPPTSEPVSKPLEPSEHHVGPGLRDRPVGHGIREALLRRRDHRGLERCRALSLLLGEPVQ